MKKFESYSRCRTWSMALLLSAAAVVTVGCGGGGGGRDPILGAGGATVVVAPPLPITLPPGAILPGAACPVAGPTVTTTDPANADQSASTSTTGVANSGKNVTASFSEAMDPATFTAATFKLAPAGGAALTPASVTYNSATNVATLATAAALSPDTTYTAIIQGPVTNGTRTPLGCSYAWTFKTATVAGPGLPPAQPPLINLGRISTFGIFATSATTSTGPTLINGDVALNPGTSQAIPPAQVNGTIPVNDQASADARTDLLTAYNQAKALPPGAGPNSLGGGANLSGLTLAPGTYTSPSTISIGGALPVTLDGGGNANATWVFQIGSALTTTTAGVSLIGSAQAKNVFWVPTSDATIGPNTIFQGTILAGRDVTGQTGATINGRLLAGAIGAGTIALDSNTVNVPAP